ATISSVQHLAATSFSDETRYQARSQLYGMWLCLVLFTLVYTMEFIHKSRSGPRMGFGTVSAVAATMIFWFFPTKSAIYLLCSVCQNGYFAFLFLPRSFIPKTPYSITELDQAYALAMGILSVAVRVQGTLRARYEKKRLRS